MNVSIRRLLALCVGVFGVLPGCRDSSAPPAAGTPPKPRIAVVPKGTTHEFWKSVHAGALRAAREGQADVTFRGPEKEDDREQQIALVQNLIAAKYDALVLAPLDNAALVGPVRQAKAAGIPVVIIDSGLDAQAGADYVSFVATDNRAGGLLAGHHLADLRRGAGTVLVLRYLEGSLSTTQREDGFIAAMASYPGITVIDPKRYAGATRATAQEAAENLLAANPGIDAVFTPNEPSTFGMLLALKARGLAGKVTFVGFDASDAAIDGMRQGHVQALVLQNPIRMGQLGVQAALDHLAGRPVTPVIDTGTFLLTPNVLDTPEARELWAPDLKALLDGAP
ncbi:MAG: hypothetical protein HBSAPP03_04520 [Phycisphaerae bacterium]|nr:MAG: hypothetical protein HBSAPP03_04520 [Phycisphaerae bacterium]